jgi:hypothetical protein
MDGVDQFLTDYESWSEGAMAVVVVSNDLTQGIDSVAVAVAAMGSYWQWIAVGSGRPEAWKKLDRCDGLGKRYHLYGSKDRFTRAGNRRGRKGRHNSVGWNSQFARRMPDRLPPFAHSESRVCYDFESANNR